MKLALWKVCGTKFSKILLKIIIYCERNVEVLQALSLPLSLSHLENAKPKSKTHEKLNFQIFISNQIKVSHGSKFWNLLCGFHFFEIAGFGKVTFFVAPLCRANLSQFQYFSLITRIWWNQQNGTLPFPSFALKFAVYCDLWFIVCHILAMQDEALLMSSKASTRV